MCFIGAEGIALTATGATLLASAAVAATTTAISAGFSCYDRYNGSNLSSQFENSASGYLAASVYNPANLIDTQAASSPSASNPTGTPQREPDNYDIACGISRGILDHATCGISEVVLGPYNSPSTSANSAYNYVDYGLTALSVLCPPKAILKGGLKWATRKFTRGAATIYRGEKIAEKTCRVSQKTFGSRNIKEAGKKSRNKPPSPAMEAEGRAHTIIEKFGREGQYTTFYGNGTWKQYRGSGRPHGNIPRPNVKESVVNEINGNIYFNKPKVRHALPEEIPGYNL